MKVFVSNGREQRTNTSYPFLANIESADDLRKAVQYDHVCAKYGDGKNTKGKLFKGYRSKKTFQSADCLPMDCDNTNPNPLEPDLSESEWKTPEDVRTAFPDVPFYVVYSRNHMKEKKGKPARPRFHIYFPMDETSNINYYEKLKREVQEHFPAFDDNAIDGARFFFGVEDPKVEYFSGDTLINRFAFKDTSLPDVIPMGSRNTILSEYAARILKRHGNSEKARQLFRDAAKRCEELLEKDELNTIWKSALGFMRKRSKLIPPMFRRRNSTRTNWRRRTPGLSPAMIFGRHCSRWGSHDLPCGIRRRS